MGTAYTTACASGLEKEIAAGAPSVAGVGVRAWCEGLCLKEFTAWGQSGPTVARSKVLLLAKHVLLRWIPGPDSPAVSLAPEAPLSLLCSSQSREAPHRCLLRSAPRELGQAQGVGHHRPNKGGS